MSARIRRRSLGSKKTKVTKKNYYIYLVTVFFLLVFGFFYLLRTKEWDGKNKLSLLVENGQGVVVVVVDPALDEIYKINIPGETEVEVAGNLGKWKVRTFWALGEQENLVGVLAARSITTGLGIPVYAWADKKAIGLIDVSFAQSISALFSSYDSNLTFGDRLHILLFSLKTENSKKININLGETSFLEKVAFSDGTTGYEVSKSRPQNILAIFSEQSYSDGIVRVSIINSTGVNGMEEDVSDVIESLGGKVSSVSNSSKAKGVCSINAKSKELLDVLLKIFECEKGSIIKNQSFDVEISLGSEFAKYY